MPPITIMKTEFNANCFESVPKNSEIAEIVSEMESFFDKVTEEIFAYYNSVKNSVTFIGMLSKVVFLEISSNSLNPSCRFTVYRLQHY